MSLDLIHRAVVKLPVAARRRFAAAVVAAVEPNKPGAIERAVNAPEAVRLKALQDTCSEAFAALRQQGQEDEDDFDRSYFSLLASGPWTLDEVNKCPTCGADTVDEPGRGWWCSVTKCKLGKKRADMRSGDTYKPYEKNPSSNAQ